MVDAPEELLDMVAESAAEYPDSVDDALEALLGRWAKCPARRTWAEELEIRALRGMIHEYRHARNVSLRREHGAYGQAAKVGLTTGATNRVAEMLLLDTYSIQGHILGSILWEDIGSIAGSEEERAKGSMFNAQLLTALKRGGQKGQAIREYVTERRIRGLFKSLGRADIVEAA